MSFYSYKNGNSEQTPGCIHGNPLEGLNERVCLHVQNVYDAAMTQQQLTNQLVTVSDIVPVLDCGCGTPTSRPCRCNCDERRCDCTCGPVSGPVTYEDAVENAVNSGHNLTPCGTWTFESCRSSTTQGNLSGLTIDRLCDRPQYARVRGTVNIPVDVLFTDQNCQEWIGRANIPVAQDVLLAIPDESIVPFTVESMVSAICVSGSYQGSCQFRITICVTVVLKILAEVELLVPSYGYCNIPPAEEFAESVCDEFFSLPMYPQSACRTEEETGTDTAPSCPCNTYSGACVSASGRTSTCASCGTTCAGSASRCPRCGCAMTAT